MAAVASVSNPPQFGTLFFGETHEVKDDGAYDESAEGTKRRWIYDIFFLDCILATSFKSLIDKYAFGVSVNVMIYLIKIYAGGHGQMLLESTHVCCLVNLTSL